MKRIALCGILILCCGWLDAQVVLSRRTYAQQGRTFQQIWIANPGAWDFRQLTRTAREHEGPVCSRDGKVIYFVSDPDPERSRNAYGGADGREIWVFDRQTGQERLIWRTSDDDHLRLIETTADGAVIIRGSAGLLRLAPNGRGMAPVPGGAFDKDGRSQDTGMSLADTATGKKYDTAVWSPDGTRIAAFSDGSLAILDATTRHEIERVSLPKTDDPPQDIVWSPDGTTLLAGQYGENAGSGDPQNDYFLLNLATHAWTPELTARQLLWLPGGTIVYLRPFETTPLAPGSPHSVWTSQLAVYDLASHKDKALTSGLVLNEDLAMCGR